MSVPSTPISCTWYSSISISSVSLYIDIYRSTALCDAVLSDGSIRYGDAVLMISAASLLFCFCFFFSGFFFVSVSPVIRVELHSWLFRNRLPSFGIGNVALVLFSFQFKKKTFFFSFAALIARRPRAAQKEADVASLIANEKLTKWKRTTPQPVRLRRSPFDLFGPPSTRRN